jgi:hypothetical protein
LVQIHLSANERRRFCRGSINFITIHHKINMPNRRLSRVIDPINNKILRHMHSRTSWPEMNSRD